MLYIKYIITIDMKFRGNNQNKRDDNLIQKGSKFKKIRKPINKVWKNKNQTYRLSKQALSQMDGFLQKCSLRQFQFFTQTSITNMLNTRKATFTKPFSEQLLQILRISKLSPLYNKVKNKNFNDCFIIQKKLVTIELKQRANSVGISIQLFNIEKLELITAIAMFNTTKICKATLFQLDDQKFLYCLLQMEKNIFVILLTDKGFIDNSIWPLKKFYDIYEGNDCFIETEIVRNTIYICGKHNIIVRQLKAKVQHTNLQIISQNKACFSLGKHQIANLIKTEKGIVVTTKDFYLYYVEGSKIFRKFRTGISIQKLFYVGCHHLNNYFLIKDKDKIKFIIICFSTQVICKSYEIDDWNGEILQTNYLNSQAYIVMKKQVDFTEASLCLFKYQPKRQIISLFQIDSSQGHSAYRIINYVFQHLINQKLTTTIF